MFSGFSRAVAALAVLSFLAGSSVGRAESLRILLAVPSAAGLPVMRMPAGTEDAAPGVSGASGASGVSGGTGALPSGGIPSSAPNASGTGDEAKDAKDAKDSKGDAVKKDARKTVPDALLISDTQLPPGVKFEVPKDALKDAKRFKYWDGQEGREREDDFVPIGKIDSRSLPANWAPDLASRDGAQTQLYVPRSAIQEPSSAGGSYSTRRATGAYYNDGPRAVPASRADSRAQQDAESRAVARGAMGIGSEVRDSGVSRPGCGDEGSRASPNDGKYLPAKALQQALDAFRKYRGRIHNDRFIAINDFTAPSSEPRMFIVDPKTGQVVKRIHVAHGSGTPGAANSARMATNFGNRDGSNLTPPGFLVTGETYGGKHGLSLRMDGLEARNSNTRARAVVIHGSDYVGEAFARSHGAVGRSWGCAAVAQSEVRPVIDMLKGGALVYNYTGTD